MQSPYLHSLKQGFADISFYSVDFLLGLLQAVTLVGVNVFLWTYIIPAPDHQTFIDRLAYFLLANGLVSIIGAARLRFSKEIRESVKSGRLSNLLLLPVNPPVLLFAEHYGTRLPELLTGLIFIAVSLFLAPPLHLVNTIAFIFTVICGFFIATAINVVSGALSFWTTEASGFNNGIIHMVRLLNGTQIKLSYITEMFGNIVGGIIYMLPFATTAFVPAYLLQVRSFGTTEFAMIVSALFWAILLMLFSSYIWKRGLRRYEATGI